jgi:hypothetical protein
MPTPRGKQSRHPGAEGRTATPTKGHPVKSTTRRRKGASASRGLPEDDLDVEISTRAKGESLVVHEVRDVQVRAWAPPDAETFHTSFRVGLPERLTPGSYGPFEAGMKVGTRLPSPPRAPAPVRAPARPNPQLPKKGPGRGRR